MSNISENKIKTQILTEFEEQLDLVFDSYKEKKIDLEHLQNSLYWLKKVWGVSRVDIKNKGNESNNIRFFERDTKYDKDLKIENPEWFSDNTGVGTKIEFKCRKKHLHFQCINDGTLEVSVRGFDYRNLNNERKPVYINCLKLSLNNKESISKDMLISHDEPFVFTKRCHNLERINLEIETKTIYYYFPELKTYFLKNNFDDLYKDYENIKKYINSQKNEQESKNIISIVEKKEENSTEKTNIGIFGSCVSVDPFRTCYNNYKKDFNKKYEHQRSTIISLMNPKFDYSDEDIKYLRDVPDQLFINSDIWRDFNKEIFNHLGELEYLVINLVHDIRWGVLSFGDTYITNSEYIPETNFYKKNIDKLRPITIYDNEEEYYELWTKNCDKFFEFLSNNYPNLKVILQKIELGEYYVGLDGTYNFRQDFHEQAQKLNPYFKKLEQYIEDNYDVFVVPFPSDTSLDEGNIWGLYSTHYSRSYYENVFSKIKIYVLEEKLKKLQK